MQRSVFLALVFSLALGGCGGSDDDDGLGTVSPELVGRWVGPFETSGPLGGQNGTADMTVGSDGRLLGSLDNKFLGATGSVEGSVGANGKTAGTYAYPLYKGSFNGQFTLQQDGHLGGTVKTFDQDGKDTGTATFDLTKQ